MLSPRLSVCIATLNRGAFIGATLDSILSQATDEVEVVIVDGASTDNTEEVVREYQQSFPGLRYHRLEKNGGVDQDYSKAVELASGEYCWLMTDDDLLKPGAIAAVLEATANRYGLIVVNAEIRNADLTQVLDLRRQKIDADKIYHPADSQEFFAEVADCLSFIGGVVIDRQFWNERNKENYFGTAFVHVGVIFQAPLPADALFIAEPWIVIRYGNALWRPRHFQIWMIDWPNLIWSFSDFPESAKRRVCPREPRRRLKKLLILRAKGIFSMTEYHTWVERQSSSAPERFAARIIALIPGWILNFIAHTYYSIVGRLGELDVAPILQDLCTSPFYYKRRFSRFAQKGEC